MEIPKDLLNKLRCDYCKNYLSCGPIYLNYKKNKTICGRCSPKTLRNIVRYQHCETIASILLFPCKYAKHGCQHKLVFTLEPQKHETICEYRKRGCPMVSNKMAPNLKCLWFGGIGTLLKHCKMFHLNKILPNPCMFQHDLTKNLTDTYLITAFETEFILNINISQITNKITYSVKLLGDEKSANFFKFSLKICRENDALKLLIKDGVVFPLDSLKKPQNITINISNLLGIFDGLIGINFVITIEKMSKKKQKHCQFCFNETKDDRACSTCSQNLLFCCFKQNGCHFNDLSAKKCQKHQLYFCKFNFECPDCNLNIKNNLFYHYTLKHKALRAKISQFFHIFEGYKQFCLLLGENEIFFIKFSLDCSRLLLEIFSPFCGAKLRNYFCEICVKDPCNAHEQKFTPHFDLINDFDWTINLNMYNYPLWRLNGLDLCINIIKKNNIYS